MSLKKITLSVVALLLLSASTMHAQTKLLDKLKKFAGPSDELIKMDSKGNYYLEDNGTVFFADNTQQNGVIHFSLDEPTKILFHPADKMKPELVKSKLIHHFILAGKTFYAVTFKESSLAIGKEKSFMEMVNTDINDKFKLFYLRQQNINKEKQFQNTPFIVDHAYFVQFQDWEKAHDSQDLTFIPFAKKMSEYVKDCTELSKKISDKEDGYKVSMFGGNANNEVVIRIMQEYNACGK
ncbi:MAG: hypothetical protein KGN97_00845 [Bacteroidota bacterium]|jgi:hypothetical protein|nr:hypothetical protein [Bacteroidota bacterium]